MEIEIGDYGKYLFQQMVKEEQYRTNDHWESIRKKAEPLVRELIKLNSAMKGGGYKLVGYVDDSGKTKLPDHKRIKLVQEKLWKVSSDKLKTGDKIWLLEDEPEMYIGQDDPGKVDDVTDKNVYVELYNWEEYTQKLEKNKDYFVLRAPKDWDDNEELYSSDEYWLQQADKLGI